MDPVAKITHLENEIAKLDSESAELKKQLASATKDKDKDRIAQQLHDIHDEKNKIRDQIMGWMERLPRDGEEPLDTRKSDGQDLSQAMAPRLMKYALLKLYDIRGISIKKRVAAVAMGVGGYVERTGPNTFTVLAVCPAAKPHLQDFVTNIVEMFGDPNVVLQPSDGRAKNAKLASIFHNGFKKVSNTTHEGTSMGLTPDDASDMASGRVTSELWRGDL